MSTLRGAGGIHCSTAYLRASGGVCRQIVGWDASHKYVSQRGVVSETDVFETRVSEEKFLKFWSAVTTSSSFLICLQGFDLQYEGPGPQ